MEYISRAVDRDQPDGVGAPVSGFRFPGRKKKRFQGSGFRVQGKPATGRLWALFFVLGLNSEIGGLVLLDKVS